MLLRCALAVACSMVLCSARAQQAPAGAGDALSPAAALELAMRHEARFRSAEAAFRAESEGVALARSRLLPELGLNVARTRNSLDSSFNGRGQPHLDYYSGGASVTVRQPLYRPESRARLRQADAENTRQAALLDGERGRLAMDLAVAYLEVLRAQADVVAERAQHEALLGLVAAARRAEPLGLGSAADRDARQAKAELANLRVLQAEAHRAEAVRRLERMVGQPVQRLLGPAEQDFVWLPGGPGPLAGWQAQARERSPDVLAAQAAVRVAREGIERARAEALPTLDLVAGRSKSTSDSYSSVNNTYFNTSLGLQLSVQLYAGGRHDAGIRQAVAQHERAQALLEGAQRELDEAVAHEYELVAQADRRLKAHQVVVRNARQALEAARLGTARGTLSTLDIADAQAQLETARAEQTTARLQMLAAQLKLHTLSGDAPWLSLAPLDRWLVEPVAVVRASSPPAGVLSGGLNLKPTPLMAAQPTRVQSAAR
ncbi:MAG: TolC family protein [Ramlibacter sp.]